MDREREAMTPITAYHNGDIILHEGDSGTCVYKILSGSVELYTAYGTPHAHRLVSLSYPSCFGETAMLTRQPHPYTAVAGEGTALMCVMKAGFETFLKNDHYNALHIMNAQAQKLISMHKLLCHYQDPEAAFTAEAEAIAFEQGDPAHELEWLTAQAQEMARRAEEAAKRAEKAREAARRAAEAQKAAEEREATRKAAEAQEAAQRAAQAQAARLAAQAQAERTAAEAQAAAEAAAQARAAAEEAAWKTAQAQAAAEIAAQAQKEAEEAAVAEFQAQQKARTAQMQAGIKILTGGPVKEERKAVASELYLPGHKGYPGITHPEYKKYVFEKKLRCPDCKESLTGYRILHSKLVAAPGSGRGRYDLRSAYNEFQPEWYALTTCPNCRFSAGYNAFAEPVVLKKDHYAARLKEIAPSINMNFASDRDLDFVFTQHYLALICAKGFSDSLLKIAQLWMNLNWLYEDVGDDHMRAQARGKAMEAFKEAYVQSRMSSVQEQRTCMMIAAMEYEVGNTTQAREWAFKVRMNRSGKALYTSLAEDLLEDIRMEKSMEK